MSETIANGLVCPLPLSHGDQIVIGHGSGGRMTDELIKKVFLPAFSNPALLAGNDAASLEMHHEMKENMRLVVSTDSHIVTPLFFPGGDIGKLAVCGTVNDVSMLGAKPLYLTAGFILEEGLQIDTLQKIIDSMKNAAKQAGVSIVAGDTKVAERNKADGIFINTTGIGWAPKDRQIGGEQARPGDIVLISGDIGDHGMAVLAARGELGFDAKIESDVAPLNHLIQSILEVAPHTHTLRDPTRGGLATTLNEIARQSNLGIWIDEASLPVKPAVQAACEMLGFDPLYIANEGKVIVITPADEAEAALSAMHIHAEGKNARIIGEVKEEAPNRVLLRTVIGGTRILEMLAGELLPRIC